MEFATSEADIAIYGGSAGGGKTFALLYEPIGRQLHEIQGFSGVIFRRSYPEITNVGGLWDEASAIYPYLGAKGIIGQCEWRFPKGPRITFRHLEHNDSVHDYQGSQICYLAFDELTHFTERQFWYMLSRNRSTCGVRPYVRATCNPDPGWVKSLLAPWVDDGFPGVRATSGQLRWFIRSDGVIKWVDSSHPDAKSLTFIRASVFDNAILLSKNPEYVSNLKALLPVERARLLDGDWNVRREGLVYSGFESVIADSGGIAGVSPTVGGMDFGFHNPFAAVWGHVDNDDVLWITGCRYKSQTTMPVHSEALPKGITWYADPSGAGQIAELNNSGHHTLPCRHLSVRGSAGNPQKPVLHGIDQVSERIRTGRLKVVREACLPLVREFALYRYNPDKLPATEEPVKEDDHAMDALRYLVVGLDRGRAVPVIEQEPEPVGDLRDKSLWR